VLDTVVADVLVFGVVEASPCLCLLHLTEGGYSRFLDLCIKKHEFLVFLHRGKNEFTPAQCSVLL
jgi:hypothetical protein